MPAPVNDQSTQLASCRCRQSLTIPSWRRSRPPTIGVSAAGAERLVPPARLNAAQGYWVNLLKVTRAGVLSRHRHTNPVHGYVLKGRWHYLEHDWVAEEGGYVYEPPGETHTLVVPDDVAEMITLFQVNGIMLYVDPDGNALGYEDVFTKISMCRKHYAAAPRRRLRRPLHPLSPAKQRFEVRVERFRCHLAAGLPPLTKNAGVPVTPRSSPLERFGALLTMPWRASVVEAGGESSS
jgi:quercetin dioxygenase-like cupin family protein